MKIVREHFVTRTDKGLHYEELVTGRYINWYCESEEETDRDIQKYHKLLLRARTGELSQKGCLTSEHRVTKLR